WRGTHLQRIQHFFAPLQSDPLHLPCQQIVLLALLRYVLSSLTALETVALLLDDVKNCAGGVTGDVLMALAP
ncbi:Hypothetical protein FKW44_021425, partial [Caligus rogercresseyi]